MTLDRGEFERIKGEYYQLRGWDVSTGRQTRWKLADLGLTDVADELELSWVADLVSPAPWQ
jgi:aldehyde:ferredoxin oxidoreductase